MCGATNVRRVGAQQRDNVLIGSSENTHRTRKSGCGQCICQRDRFRDFAHQFDFASFAITTAIVRAPGAIYGRDLAELEAHWDHDAVAYGGGTTQGMAVRGWVL
ncbi:MAG: hypothetical protein J2P55_06700 [Rhizobiales bacterium]|nr:hypothetical protein [Hyphomicrobiales bacterium]